MDVSVVVPLYNGERWIEDTLRCVLAQTDDPCEIVVVDDGSDDGSPAIVRSSFPQVKLIQAPGEGGTGAGAARDYGVRHTSGSLIAFLDQDDLWHPSHLATTARLLQESTCCAAVAGIDHFEESDEPTYDLQSDDPHIFSPWDRFPVYSIHTPSCAVVRRSALEEIGGWPAQFMMSDLHTWFLLATVAPMLHTGRVTVGRRQHGTSSLQALRTDRSVFFIQERIRICEDALAFRAQAAQEADRSEEKDLQNRLDVLRGVGGVIEGSLRDDRQRLIEGAYMLEKKGAVDSDVSLAIWSATLWLFRSEGSQVNIRRQRRILEGIIRHWPAECSSASKTLLCALTQHFSYRAFLLCALQNPIQASKSPLFRACLKKQIEKLPSPISF